MKGRRWASAVPICPLYKFTEPQCVFCDGQQFSSLRISFPDKKSRVDFMKQYCEQSFQECPVYDAFTKKEK